MDDDARFEALARQHAGLIRAACLRQAPPAEVDDCAQAVLLVFARRRREALAAPVLEAWLLRVAWYVCARARRAAARRRAAEAAAAALPRPDPPMTEPRALLDRCLQELPERQRQAIILHHLGGLAHEAVAQRLGLSAAAVRQQCHRGLERLRERFARAGAPIGAAALLALLATEAEAAAAGTSAAALPTAAAADYAEGALAAMSTATTTAVTATAAIVLLIVVAAWVVHRAPAADPAPRPVDAPPPALVAAPAPPRLAAPRLPTLEAATAGGSLDLDRVVAEARAALRAGGLPAAARYPVPAGTVSLGVGTLTGAERVAIAGGTLAVWPDGERWIIGIRLRLSGSGLDLRFMDGSGRADGGSLVASGADELEARWYEVPADWPANLGEGMKRLWLSGAPGALLAEVLADGAPQDMGGPVVELGFGLSPGDFRQRCEVVAGTRSEPPMAIE